MLKRDPVTGPSRARLICIGLGCLAIGVTLGLRLRPLIEQWATERATSTEYTKGFSPRELHWIQGEGGNGAVARISTIADHDATLNEGFVALAMLGGSPCALGRSHTSIPAEPWPSVVDPRLRYPAGTRFVSEIRCEGALPNEFSLPADTTDAAAQAAVEQHLADASDSKAQHVVSRLSYNDKRQKYHVFKEHLGNLTASMVERCKGQVVVHKIVVGAYPHPAPEQAPPLNDSTLVVGSDIRCASAPALAALQP